MKSELKNENEKFSVELKDYEKVSPICRKDCRVCNSGYMEEIHLLRKTGKNYDEILKIIKDKYNFSISEASLSRHFQNYKKHIQLKSAEIINADIIEEATKQAVHQKALIELIDIVLKRIRERLELNILDVDIADLERLVKLRYQVLSGAGEDENEILLIAQKAFSKYGVNDNQQILFKQN